MASLQGSGPKTARAPRRRTIEWGERDDETYRSRACVVKRKAYASCLQVQLLSLKLAKFFNAGTFGSTKGPTKVTSTAAGSSKTS